jgi:hypothetical protein
VRYWLFHGLNLIEMGFEDTEFHQAVYNKYLPR